MIEATDLKAGATFRLNGKLYKVLKYQHQKLGRGGAIVKVSAKNLETGSLEEKSFSSNIKVEEISTLRRPLQFLYRDGENTVFMDPKSYEQIEIPTKLIKEELYYIKEGDSVNVLFWASPADKESSDRALSIDIPPKVSLAVVDTPPGVKGDSATNIFKTAKLENGLILKVPLFIKVGDKVIVDTRIGEYVERIK